MIPEAVQTWLAAQGYGEVRATRPVGGGCISNGARIETSGGGSFFLKTNASAPADMFACEAAGLEALRAADGPRLPRVFLHGREFLLLEDLAPAKRAQDYERTLGGQLAAMHNHTNSQFGFEHDNYIGSTPQPNAWTTDGYTFFAEQRLGYQARLAVDRGLLNNDEAGRVEALAGRLKELIPVQPASLVHGDLWGGNATADSRGQPVLIDPAAHYGWAEAELAMTALFGGFGADFYGAYVESRPLAAGYRERFPCYNLYHVLNHLNLFGRSYHGQVISILDRYK